MCRVVNDCIQKGFMHTHIEFLTKINLREKMAIYAYKYLISNILQNSSNGIQQATNYINRDINR